MKRHRLHALAATIAALLLVSACGDSTAPVTPGAREDTTSTDSMPTQADPPLTDSDLLAFARPDSTWTWWEHSDSLLERAGASPHGDRIRVRYNATAPGSGSSTPTATWPTRWPTTTARATTAT